jgi:quercetin dioxygenase-like cupin family protein
MAVVLIGGCAVSMHSSNVQDDRPANPAPVRAPTTLPSGVYNWDQLTVQSTNVGQRRSVFDAPTATVSNLEFHITTLNPGQASHEPHRHANEELVMLKEGTLEAFINGKTIPMPTGSVLFLAPNDLHAVRNVGTTPATYFVVAWRTPKTGPAQ